MSTLQGPHSFSNRHWRLFLESQGVTNLIKLPCVFRSCWTTKKHTARKLQFHSKKSNHLFQPRDCSNLLQAQFWLGFFWYKKKIRNHHSNHCCHLSSRRCIPHGQRWGVSRLYNGWMHHVRCACVMKFARNEGKNSCNRSSEGSSPSWENWDLPNVGNFWRLLLPAFVKTLEGWDVAKRCSHQRLVGRFLWATLELQPSPRLCSSEKLWLQ